MKDWVVARIKEPSTWAGLAAALLAASAYAGGYGDLLRGAAAFCGCLGAGIGEGVKS